MKKIPVNIWDDFYEDGSVPEGKLQTTYAYIEEYDEITDEEKTPMMKVVYDFILTLNMPNVIVENDGGEISFTNLTHVKLDELILDLRNANLKYNGIPFSFYSES